MVVLVCSVSVNIITIIELTVSMHLISPCCSSDQSITQPTNNNSGLRQTHNNARSTEIATRGIVESFYPLMIFDKRNILDNEFLINPNGYLIT